MTRITYCKYNASVVLKLMPQFFCENIFGSIAYAGIKNNLHLNYQYLTAMVRKIDFYAQVLLVALALMLAIISIFNNSYFFGAVFTLLPLGMWQLISAGLITLFSKIPGEKAVLTNYWKSSISCLIVFIAAFFFRNFEDNTVAIVMIITAMSGGFIIAFYYLFLYKKHLLNPAKNNTPAIELQSLPVM